MTTTKTAAQLVSDLNAVHSTMTAAQVEKAVTAIKEAVKAENAAAVDIRAAQLVKMDDRAQMFVAYINDPTVPIVKLAQSKTTGEYKLTHGKRNIPFAKLEATYQRINGTKHADGTVDPDKSKTLTQSKRYAAMLSYFADNMTRLIAGDLSENGSKKVSVPSLTAGTADQRKEYDFTGSSINALESQLNAIVSTILPADMVVKMKRVDVRALKQAATKEKLLDFTMKNETDLLAHIFAAVKVRMNDDIYKLSSNAKAHKEKKVKTKTANEKQSAKTEEKMSRVPERPEAAKTLSKKQTNKAKCKSNKAAA